MNFWKKATTDWQYLHNVESTNLILSLSKQNDALTKRVEALEKFAIGSQKYFDLIEARREAELKKKGNKK